MGVGLWCVRRLAICFRAGGVGSLQVRPPLCPQYCGPFTLHGRLGCSGYVDLPISYPSLLLVLLLLVLLLLLSLYSPMIIGILNHGDASSTSPSASLRPKATSHGGSLSYESGDIGTTKILNLFVSVNQPWLFVATGIA